MSNVHALQLLVISNTAWDGSSDKAAERGEDAVVQYCNATKEVRAFSCFFNFFTGAGRSGIRNILLSFSKSITVIYLYIVCTEVRVKYAPFSDKFVQRMKSVPFYLSR
jgi:hypothetical protein